MWPDVRRSAAFAEARDEIRKVLNCQRFPQCGRDALFQSTNRNGRRNIQSRYILMPVSMLVKCEKCGYENFPQHRFCGMCAAELRLPGPGGTPLAPPPRQVPSPTLAQPKAAGAAPRAKEVAPQPVSRPSFLGSGNERAEIRSVSYLLEDEPAPRHTGRNLVLLILLAGAIAAGWHWRENLVSLVSKFSSNAAGNTQANSSAPAGSDSTSPTAPASGANASTPVGNQGAGADAQVPVAQGQTTPPAAPASGGADSAQSPEADQSQPSAQSPAGDSGGAAKNDDSDETANQPAPAPKSPKVRTQSAPTPVSRADELEAEGEKYLYGNGVPENCTRARSSLLAAAQHSNAQAQNVLGTMYATGHCATRDLPTAYRWFSRSLRKDPSNTRIEQDLKVLWNQMTPEERQLALRDQR
jgi:hypothetical protein